MALIPNIASWATGLMDNVLSAAGTSAAALGEDKLLGAGVVYTGLKLLGGGAILAGLMLGAIVAFVIDRKFLWAAGYATAAAGLSFIGLIHGEKVEWNAEGQVALGYLLAAGLLVAFHFVGGAEPDEAAGDQVVEEPLVQVAAGEVSSVEDADVTAAK
jgi:AGZA family xanthine/uracil permease-like MFS transporter